MEYLLIFVGLVLCICSVFVGWMEKNSRGMTDPYIIKTVRYSVVGIVSLWASYIIGFGLWAWHR